MKPKIAQSKGDYTRLICKYHRLRKIMKAKMKEKYGYEPLNRHNMMPMPLEYRKFSNRCINRIKMYRRAIRRIDGYTAKMKEANEQMKSVMKINVKWSVGNETPRYTLAKRIFSKYLLEQGIRGPYISQFLGAKDKMYAARNRMSLTKSFATTPYNREMYHRFLNHMNNIRIIW